VATLLNLVLNAAQAMGGHGRVNVTLRQSGNFATIEVRDTDLDAGVLHDAAADMVAAVS
jgi:signal transduction histidine kinase